MGFVTERHEAPIFLLALAVVVHCHGGKLGDVPELDELVMGAACQEVDVSGLGDLFYGLSNVLTQTADDAVRHHVDGPEDHKTTSQAIKLAYN